jgi:thioredoxin reductase
VQQHGLRLILLLVRHRDQVPAGSAEGLIARPAPRILHAAAQFPGQLVPGLAVEGNAVKVDLQMKTNLPGLFAAGDIAGQPYQYIKSAGQGNVAALSAVNYLAEKQRKQ